MYNKKLIIKYTRNTKENSFREKTREKINENSLRKLNPYQDVKIVIENTNIKISKTLQNDVLLERH